MHKDALYIGIDIGGTNTVTGLVTRHGQLVDSERFATSAHEPARIFLDRLYNTIARLAKSTSGKIKGIGIGMPGAYSDNGAVYRPVNFAWGDVDLVDILHKQYDLPVFLTNDARAAALGEMRFGQARDIADFIQITLGTGFGSCFVVDGRIIQGSSGLAGEMGHTKISADERLCKCGKKGCLETYVSAGGICRTFFELISSDSDNAALNKYDFEQLSPRIITESAEKGNALAQKAYAITGAVLGEKLADFVQVLNPSAILVSGGLTAAGRYLFQPMKQALNDNLLFPYKNKTEIRISDPQVNFAVLGAASLMMNDQD